MNGEINMGKIARRKNTLMKKLPDEKITVSAFLHHSWRRKYEIEP